MCSGGTRSITLGRYAQRWDEKYYNGERRTTVGWDALCGIRCSRLNEIHGSGMKSSKSGAVG